MKTWSLPYRNWLIWIVPLPEGWAFRCLSPDRQQTYTDWDVYKTLAAAIAGAKEYVNRATATYQLAEVMLDLFEAGKIQDSECYRLLLSLGYA